MGRRPLVPQSLTEGPFTVHDARLAGLDRWHLEGASWKRLSRGTYVWAGLPDTAMCTLAGAWQRLCPGAAFSGLTAAWLHGIDVQPCDPIEVTVPKGSGISGRAGIRVRRADLDEQEVVRVRGVRATTLVRTVAELCGRLSVIEAVTLADAALHSGRLRIPQLTAWAKAGSGRPGIKKLRRVISFVEPAAESPMESRLRMVLVLGGLPRPRAQVSIHDSKGRFVGRPDLYYEEARLGIEYDGGIHRNALVEDDRRQNNLLNAGVRLLRFTSADVLQHPASVLIQVRAMLTSIPRLPATAALRREAIARMPANAGF